MTNERRKSILVLSGTLILGILLGILIPGLVHKISDRGFRNQHEAHKGPRKDWFVGTIIRVVKPDSSQAEKIRPIARWASDRIEALELRANSEMSSIMDSVKVQLKPILTGDQWQRLEEFDARAKSNWVRNPGRPR